MAGWVEIKNSNGERVWVENRVRSHARCKYCGAVIFWGTTDDIELVVELEEAFGVEIEDAIAKDFKTVADVVRCVEEKISAKRGGL